MAENNANNGNGGPNLATPSKRAEKKQDTRPTPERMKQKETGTMEIDTDVVMEIQDPPKLHSTNKEGKKSESKVGGTIDMTMEGESTPPSTPRQKGDMCLQSATFTPRSVVWGVLLSLIRGTQMTQV